MGFNKYKGIICYAFVLILGIIGCIWVLNISYDKPVAKIYSNNKLLYEIDLTVVEENHLINIENDIGGCNKVLVEKNAISVVEATCPDHICINQGKISDGATPIVCLPNKLVIKIENKKSTADAVTG